MPDADARQALRTYACPRKAAILQGFFKTGAGEYGHGDIFIGVKVPEIRSIAARFNDMPAASTISLLHSHIHEERLLALVILVNQFDAGNKAVKENIFRLYLDNTPHINNWDLVDISAPRIPGQWLLDKDRSILDKLAISKLLWERRISIVSTLAFIRNNQCNDTYRIATLLMQDTQDLIHKASGWMLREAGKRNRTSLEKFITQHLPAMPRTMLRYAIEKFPDKQRKKYLQTPIKKG